MQIWSDGTDRIRPSARVHNVQPHNYTNLVYHQHRSVYSTLSALSPFLQKLSLNSTSEYAYYYPGPG